jgi:drug/metabolite transporter (DMT)-like permease
LAALIQKAPRDGAQAAGALMVLLGAGCFSTGGLILRGFGTTDGWQILFYRSLPYCLMVLAFIAIRHRGDVLTPLRGIGCYGPVLGLAIAGSSAFYIFAVQHTTVANVLFTFSSAPFLAALMGRWILGERVRIDTWLCIAAATVGVGLMVADGLGTGTVVGTLLALGMALSYASTIVVVRHAQGIDMLPATVWGAVISAAIAALAGGSFRITGHDLGLAIIFGTVNMGAGIMLVATGSRFVPAARAALLALLESVLAPLWVWLALGETPSRLTLMGGAIVLAAVAGQAVSSMRRQPAPG